MGEERISTETPCPHLQQDTNKTHPLQFLQQTARSIASIESTLIKVRRTLDTDDE